MYFGSINFTLKNGIFYSCISEKVVPSNINKKNRVYDKMCFGSIIFI